MPRHDDPMEPRVYTHGALTVAKRVFSGALPTSYRDLWPIIGECLARILVGRLARALDGLVCEGDHPDDWYGTGLRLMVDWDTRRLILSGPTIADARFAVLTIPELEGDSPTTEAAPAL